MSEMIFLDNAATSYPKPESVYAFMDGFYRRAGVNPGRSGYDLCMEAGELLDGTRKLLTRFFNGTDPNRLCFTYNATDALNLIIFGLLQEGDHAITTTLEHNSVLRPLYHLWKSAASKSIMSPSTAMASSIPARSGVVSNPTPAWSSSTMARTSSARSSRSREIGRLCREAGIIFAIDTSQTAGKVPIDLDADFIDVLAFTGHKSLLGPTGIGGVYVGDGVEIRQTRAGGTGVRSAVRLIWRSIPTGWSMEPRISWARRAYAGVTWVMEKGMDAIASMKWRFTCSGTDCARSPASGCTARRP